MGDVAKGVENEGPLMDVAKGVENEGPIDTNKTFYPKLFVATTAIKQLSRDVNQTGKHSRVFTIVLSLLDRYIKLACTFRDG